MSSNWPTVKLGDFCKKIGSGATPRGGASVYMDDGEICLIRSQNVHNEGFNPNGLVYIDEDAAKKLSNVIVEENDVLLNITGDSVARVCLAKSRFLPARVNQHVAIIRPDEGEFDPRFIRYLLASPTYQNILLSIAAVGATRNALTKGMIENLDVLKPPIEQQIEMANQLEALDKKIDINSQTNQTLEEIAQAIFKSWFVDFDPVKAKIETLATGGSADDAELAAMSVISAKTLDELNSLKVSNPEAFNKLAQTAALFPAAMQDSELGEIPEGWEVVTIKSLSEKISKGTTPSKKDLVQAQDEESIRFIKVKDINDQGEILRDSLEVIPNSIHIGKLRRSILEKNDILFSIAGTIGRVATVDNDLNNVNTNQAVAFIRLEDKKHFLPLVYMTLRDRRLQDKALASIVQGVQANLSLNSLGDMEVILPSNEVLELWNKQYKSIFKMIKSNFAESRKLSSLRDTLLPKLLAGEIDLTSEVTA
ncbi:restriction endonuclease subunit S [Vibrio vulnificus]|nr:restriction endonuclease subunit S [Vibrio vulnificus]